MRHTSPSSATRSASPVFRLAAQAVAIACLASAASTALAQPAGQRILLQPRAGLPDGALERIVDEHGGQKARRLGRSELRVIEVKPGQEARGVAERLARHPHLKFAEVDRALPLQLSANDPYLGSQWHLPRMNVPAAWDATQGAGITIAVLDTGVDPAHPDLAARLVPGYNFFDRNTVTADVQGHGTLVAGAAAAAGNNGVGVAGVAAQAAIMPLRISGTDGMATISAIAEAITWAADRGARVANVSYQAGGFASVQSAASYMKSKGGLVTVSAGNSGGTDGSAPTNTLVVVGATDSNDAIAGFSTFGPYVSVSAPGVGVWTTSAGGGYAAASGTSFSAPVTAGVIGLMMAARPDLSADQILGLLVSTSTDLGAPGRDDWYGAGRVDADRAVRAAVTAPSNVDRQAPVVAITSPGASAAVSGLVAVATSASDNVGVSRVELRVNGTLLATDTGSPFSFSWDSSRVPNGSATLVATAFDAAGNSAASAPLTVTVSNVADTTAPVVTLTNPRAGATVSGQVSITATASDNAGTAGLRNVLSINNVVVGSSNGGSLNFRWNTNRVPAGTHTISVTTTDAAGNRATQSVQVRR